MNTAGRAILFAGATVVIALMGMFALGVSFLYGAAIAASLGVLLVLAASLTLLPALADVHRQARRPRAPPALRAHASPAQASGSAGSGSSSAGPVVGRARRRPCCCSHSPRRRSGCGSARATPATTPPKQTTRHAYDLLAAGFGSGFNGPLLLAVAMSEFFDQLVGWTLGLFVAEQHARSRGDEHADCRRANAA